MLISVETDGQIYVWIKDVHIVRQWLEGPNMLHQMSKMYAQGHIVHQDLFVRLICDNMTVNKSMYIYIYIYIYIMALSDTSIDKDQSSENN